METFGLAFAGDWRLETSDWRLATKLPQHRRGHDRDDANEDGQEHKLVGRDPGFFGLVGEEIGQRGIRSSSSASEEITGGCGSE